MKKINKELFIGILILAISACSLFIKSIPIIWIGGFIWGGSLIVKSLEKKKHHSYSYTTSEIEKEIITCDNCKQRIRVPKDRQKYVNITCPHCKQNPFLSLSDRFHRSPRKTKLLWVGGLIFLISIITYALFKSPGSTSTISTNNVPITLATTQNTQVSPIISVPTNIISFSNGEFLYKNSYYLDGLGKLKITNGTSNSAVAKLVNTLTNKSVATVYIEANSVYMLGKISDGSYKLVFNLGHDWDTISKKFTRNSNYSVFEESFDFNTYTTNDGDYRDTHYSTYEVTLNTVIGGTAQTEDINPSEFANY